jgi:rhodanese-related sulfurtransferase
VAADTLQQMGYTKVVHLDGGFKAWKEADLPVEEDRPKA